MSNERIQTPYGTLYQNAQRANIWHLTGSVPLQPKGVYRFNKSCQTTNLNDARRKAKDIYLEAEKASLNKKVIAVEVVKQGPVTLADELNTFIYTFYEVPAKSGELDETTWEDAEKCLNKFFNNCQAVLLSELTDKEVTDTWNRIGKISAKYKAKVVFAVRKFMRWEIKKGNFTKDPTEDVKAPARKLWGKGKDEEPWELEHYKEYLAACKAGKIPFVRDLDYEIFIILRHLGISQADVYSLTHTDFTKDAVGLVLDKEREKSGIRYNQPIVKKDDPMSKACEEIILARMAVVPKGERLFKQGDTDQDRWVNDMTNRRRRIQLALGHPIRTTKGLRSMYVTEKILGGIPEFVLLRWIGHSEDSTILRQHYLRLQSTRQWA
jgi:hypothetical protein